MRIVFMGTPDFAATILQRVHEWAPAHSSSVVAVYCQPDRPAGRGRALTSPAVKCLAECLEIPVKQPLNFRESADCEALAAFKPDVLLVAAYGLLLPQTVLDIPTIGPFNVHASLLPRYRGAAPIQRALMQGDTTTGVTIMRMEAGLDTGPMLVQRALVIGADETSAALHDELANLGTDLLLELFENILAKQMPSSISQNDAYATHAAKLTKADGLIDWAQTGVMVHAQIRGVTPWPSAQTFLYLQGRKPIAATFGIGRSMAFTDTHCPPFDEENIEKTGAVLGLHEGCLAIRVSDGLYLLPELCPAGKKMMRADAFARGYGCIGFASAHHELQGIV